MKTAVFTVLVLALASISFAHDPKTEDPKMAEMMKKFQAYATPGAQHKTLAGLTGKWKSTSKMWETADAKPEESTGVSTFKMILGGRFLQQEYKGKAMGAPFEGVALTGYNNLKNQYETLWLDSMSTGIMHGTANFDEGTQTLKDSGEFTCPMTESHTRTYRSELKMIDKNNMIFSMWSPGLDGKEFKGLEIAYKRAK